MRDEQEYIFHQNIDDDESAKVRHHDDERTWTVESYDPKVTRRMIELGAPALPSRIDGHLFAVDAKQLIEFIAESSGLNVEFRNRKRQQLSAEAMAAKRQRMAELNAKQRMKV
mgnify:CR=1 FL=1